ncbi:MAG: DUF5704 domain-containing protein [Lachnospiraceae bacterium]|nr:DUF5704 domain-containing protein [Lachnospiraceae bacterium]
MGKSSFKRISVFCLVFLLIFDLLAPAIGALGESERGYRYGDTIRGNIVSAEDKNQGNDRWSADPGVVLGEGTLWWIQDHNPLGNDRTRTSEEGNDVPGKLMYTSNEVTDVVYYRTVGIRFTLEDISRGEEYVSTIDMDVNRDVWEKNDVKFVDVFLTGVDARVKTRTADMLESGYFAGGRRRVGNAVMETKDINNGSGVIEGHYYISDFLKRDSNGNIDKTSVVGMLIDLECGGDRLPAGEWRIYASHIIEIMTAKREKQPNGQYVLKDRQERFVRDNSGKLVPDIHTTILDVLDAATWTQITRDEYLPALYNRYIELVNEKLISTSIVLNYYMKGKDPVGNTVKTVTLPPLNPRSSAYPTVEIVYGDPAGTRPKNLSLGISGEAFDGKVHMGSIGGISVFAGNSENTYGSPDNMTVNPDNMTVNPNNMTGIYSACFEVSGNNEKSNITLTGLNDGSGGFKNVSAPFICVWIPLKSEIKTHIMYITDDDKKPVLVRDGGIFEIGGENGEINMPLETMFGSEAQKALADPVMTADGAEYELAEDLSGKGVRYFYGTGRWNLIENTSVSEKKSLFGPDRTVNSLTLTGSNADGRRYGVMGGGTGRKAVFRGDEYITDAVFFVRVKKKAEPIDVRRLYVRYVPACGDSHILRDTGAIPMPLGEEYVYVHSAPGQLLFNGKNYRLSQNPTSAQRALLGVTTREADRLPRAYSTVTGQTGADIYTQADTGITAEGGFYIKVPPDVRDAMLFIPYDEEEDADPGAQINIYYIKGLKQGGYKVLNSDKRTIEAGAFEAAQAEGKVAYEFGIRREVTDLGTGARWKPMEKTGEGDYKCGVWASKTASATLGNTGYPMEPLQEGWQVADYYREDENDRSYVGLFKVDGARSYDVFIPCEIKSGNNPIKVFAIDASTGKRLQSEPIATSFMSGTEDLIDVSACEEIAVSGKTYVMLDSVLEEKKIYPYQTAAYAYKNIQTQAIASTSEISVNVVKLTTYVFDGAGDVEDGTAAGTTAAEYSSRNVYIGITGLGIPAGNVIALYIPFRTSADVNVYLITDENTEGKLPENAVAYTQYKVSRSYLIKDPARLKKDNSKTESESGGWFEFEVPCEIDDGKGVTYSLAGEEALAVHRDSCCDGVLQKVGMCAEKCPLCNGTGIMTLKTKAGEASSEGKCTLCDGSGIWITAMNYKRVTEQEILSNHVTRVKYRCNTCGGTGHDPGHASKAGGKKNCPECNPWGRGANDKCPSCEGRGKISYRVWEYEERPGNNGNYVGEYVWVVKYMECSVCKGTGEYTCGTCDGSGLVDADLCENCYTAVLYPKLGNGGNSYGSIVTYGTGYRVNYRGICMQCGGKGYSVCKECNGTGWSNARDETGHAVPCPSCGGARLWREAEWGYQNGSTYMISAAHWVYRQGEGQISCNCTKDEYVTDPANGDPDYSRGRVEGYYDNFGEYRENRDNTSFMTGGYYCEKCNAYILSAGYPFGHTLLIRKDSEGKSSISVYNMKEQVYGIDKTLYPTEYRTVEFVDREYGTITNHEKCGLEDPNGSEPYAQALLDTGRRTETEILKPGKAEGVGGSVLDQGKTEGVGMRVFVPDDSGMKATDVYVLYTEWQPFKMPDPEPRVNPPEPYERKEDIVYTDMETDDSRIEIIAGYNDGVIYDPSLSIPSGRDLVLKATAKEYLYDMKIVNVTGMLETPVTIRYPYAFYESAAAYRRGDEPKDSGFIEKTVIVKRPYSYWSVERFALWRLREASALCNVFKVEDTGYERIAAGYGKSGRPNMTLMKYGGVGDHIVGGTVGESLTITVDGTYADIYRSGTAPALPDIDEGYCERVAYEALPKITARDDVLLFEGRNLIGEGTPAAPAITGRVELISNETGIPDTKKNGKYPVVAATVEYAPAEENMGADNETKYRGTDRVAPVVVQTPVYVRGSLAMTPDDMEATDNRMYVQQKGADASQIWAVLGEERAYAGYDKDLPSLTYCTCDLYMKLTNTANAEKPHLTYPGYGIRKYDEDICTPRGELPYNRISCDTEIVVDRSFKDGKICWEPDFIENAADTVVEAGKWLSVPADTTIRFIVPKNTREGRHSITFVSVAKNDPEPLNPLGSAMENANTYYLSHAAYDKCFFNVAGRIWGLRLEENSEMTRGLRLEENPGCTGESEQVIGAGTKSAAGLLLADPPQKFFPAGKSEGIMPGVTARFSVMINGVRAAAQAAEHLREGDSGSGRGLRITPKILFVPRDDKTGKLRRNDAVEAQLWYDTGPYTGKSGLARYEPEIKYRAFPQGHQVSDEERIDMTLFIPAGVRAAIKGSMDALPKDLGFSATSEKWLKNGAILISFEAELTYVIADRTVTVGYDCGPVDMWKLEGWSDRTEYFEGDVIILDLMSDIRDTTFTDHLN